MKPSQPISRNPATHQKTKSTKKEKVLHPKTIERIIENRKRKKQRRQQQHQTQKLQGTENTFQEKPKDQI